MIWAWTNYLTSLNTLTFKMGQVVVSPSQGNYGLNKPWEDLEGSAQCWTFKYSLNVIYYFTSWGFLLPRDKVLSVKILLLEVESQWKTWQYLQLVGHVPYRRIIWSCVNFTKDSYCSVRGKTVYTIPRNSPTVFQESSVRITYSFPFNITHS